VLVAQDAGERKVVLDRLTAVLLGHDVIDPVRRQGDLLRNEAPLATLAGPRPNQPAEPGGNLLLGHTASPSLQFRGGAGLGQADEMFDVLRGYPG
jgi:hypothetical protein